MDDKLLIARTLPENWQAEAYGSQWPGIWILFPADRQGYATIDLVNRTFSLGQMVPLRRRSLDPQFSGRNWKATLILAAVDALRAALA